MALKRGSWLQNSKRESTTRKKQKKENLDSVFEFIIQD
jgi:hypothetical protein